MIGPAGGKCRHFAPDAHSPQAVSRCSGHAAHSARQSLGERALGPRRSPAAGRAGCVGRSARVPARRCDVHAVALRWTCRRASSLGGRRLLPELGGDRTKSIRQLAHARRGGRTAGVSCDRHAELQRSGTLHGWRRACRRGAAARCVARLDGAVRRRALQARAPEEGSPQRPVRRGRVSPRARLARLTTSATMASAKTPEGFSLRRWSRRKLEAVRESEAKESPGAVPPAPEPPAAVTVQADAAPPPDAVPPELPPVESLTAESDFTAFMHPKVDEGLRRQALKKLFSDPRFNVMDGLDVYIDDYTKPDPIPPSVLERLAQSGFVRGLGAP